MRTSIDIETLLTIMYVLVDDWYQAKGQKMLKGKPGPKPTFSDSEVMSLVLAMDFIPFPGETQFLGYIRANHLALFPELLSQSQFNRRARSLRLLIEEMRRSWLQEMGIQAERQFLLDTKPVPVVGYKRSKKHSDFAGSAEYGYCESRKLKYFGYKLVTLATLDGMPVINELVPANLDEREAAEAVLFNLFNCDIFADKGFIGEEWQAQIRDETGNRVWTVKRHNQYVQNPAAFDTLLSRVRERIEGVFHEIQNSGRNLERLRARTVIGLCTRVIAKLASHALKFLLRRNFGIDVQSFTVPCGSAF
ncbi:MAG: IS982 family transposase [Chloroflexota bacterium]